MFSLIKIIEVKRQTNLTKNYVKKQWFYVMTSIANRRLRGNENFFYILCIGFRINMYSNNGKLTSKSDITETYSLLRTKLIK